TTIGRRLRRTLTAASSSTTARRISQPRSPSTAAPGRSSIRSRHANLSGWCWPKRWCAALRSQRSTRAPSAKLWRTASPESCSATWSRWPTSYRACSTSTVAGCGTAPSRASERLAWSPNTSPYTAASSRPIVPHANPKTVLAVFAHPDDESLTCGGTLARLADAGVRVVLLCASHGRKGAISDPALVPDGDLGSVRADELRQAAQVLGIADVVILDHPDGDLRW